MGPGDSGFRGVGVRSPITAVKPYKFKEPYTIFPETPSRVDASECAKLRDLNVKLQASGSIETCKCMYIYIYICIMYIYIYVCVLHYCMGALKGIIAKD